MGYRKAESSNTVSVKQTKTTLNEPHPITIFGESKPISDTKIGKYLTDEIFYYINLYVKIKKFGLPHIYKSWLDVPQWLMELYDLFELTEIEHEHFQMSKHNN